MFKKILLLLLLFASILSCKHKDENAKQTTWIGGQVVNPKLDYIVFSQGDQVLDTVVLDSNNFFLYQTDKIKPGLYSLRHGESQVFYIEPGDSLIMHINTIDFDESLAYSGRGSERNNLMMDFFLANEVENKNLSKWYNLTPEAYEEKIDSLKALKTNKYEEFLESNKETDGFKEVAQACIDYYYYSKKELYIAANMSKIETIPDAFFAYRKKIDFEKDNLRFYYPYYRFLNRYFDNVVSSQYRYGNVNRQSYEYNYKKLKLIDSLVSKDSLKNVLLRFNTVRYLLNAKNAEDEQKIAAAFSEMNSDKKHNLEIADLVQATVKLTAGNTVPNILLVNTDNVAKDLQSIVNSPTVLYFWSAQSVSQFRNIHSRAAELKSKYPEYNFIGINTDSHFKKWRETIKNAGYNPDREFQLENLADAEKKLVLNSMNKVIILDKSSVILEGNTNMFNSNFEELLLGYLNR